MITLQEICRYLDGMLACNQFTDYATNGLQVQGKSEVKRIGTAVTASLAAIEGAVKEKVDLLLVHHGLFWERDSYVIQGVKYNKLDLLLKHGISLLAYHLPLDAHQEFGNNWRAAKDMGWQNLQPFGIYNKVPIGVQATFPTSSRAELQHRLEKYYGHPAHCALGGKETVSSIALVSGGAYKMINDAVIAGVDCYVTGNFDEPVWHIAFEEKINFFALGHAATERIGPKAIGKHLQDHFRLDWKYIEDTNPF